MLRLILPFVTIQSCCSTVFHFHVCLYVITDKPRVYKLTKLFYRLINKFALPFFSITHRVIADDKLEIYHMKFVFFLCHLKIKLLSIIVTKRQVAKIRNNCNFNFACPSSIFPSIHPSFIPFIYIYIPTYLSLYLYLSMNLSIYISIYLSIYLPIQISRY